MSVSAASISAALSSVKISVSYPLRTISPNTESRALGRMCNNLGEALEEGRPVTGKVVMPAVLAGSAGSIGLGVFCTEFAGVYRI